MAAKTYILCIFIALLFAIPDVLVTISMYSFQTQFYELRERAAENEATLNDIRKMVDRFPDDLSDTEARYANSISEVRNLVVAIYNQMQEAEE